MYVYAEAMKTRVVIGLTLPLIFDPRYHLYFHTATHTASCSRYTIDLLLIRYIFRIQMIPRCLYVAIMMTLRRFDDVFE